MSDLKVNEIKTDTIKNQAGTSAIAIDNSGNTSLSGTLAVTGVHTVGTNAVFTSDGGGTSLLLRRSVAKLFVNYADNASINDQINISSMIDGGTGVHTSNITSNMSNSVYTLVSGCGGYHEHCCFAGRNTTSFPSYGRDNESNSGNYDINAMIVGFGDLA